MTTSETPRPSRLVEEAALREALEGPRFLLFKHSPICPISDRARGIVAEHGIRHESPQALLFSGGRCLWHASHEAINEANLHEALKALD